MGAFSIFSNKKSKKKREGLPTVEEYYLRLARRTTLAKFICIILISGFALFSFSNYKDELSIDNFRYMIKFIDFGAESTEEAPSVIFFDSEETNKYELLRGDIGVLSVNGFSVYDYEGNRILQSDFKYDHPKMVSTSRNIIVCDLGGYNLKVFNPFSVVYNETFSYPIFGVSASESGGFVVVSAAKGYRSAFFVYDEYYRVIYNYYFGDKYIDCAALSEDGREVAVLLHHSEDGQLITRLMKFSVSDESATFQTEFADELPLQVSFMSDGSYALLTSEALRFFSADNQITGEIFFKEKSLLGYEFGKNYVIITYNTLGLSTQTELDVYAKDGTVCVLREFEGALLDMCLSEDNLYVLSHGSLSIIDITGQNTDKTYETDNEFRQLLLDGESIILFSQNRAEYFKEPEPQNYKDDKQ